MELHLTTLVPDQIIKALCNTFIHSLWQGLILAVVTGITILLTKRASASLRYNLLISYLLLFTVAIAFTFYKQLPASHGRVVNQVVAFSPTLTAPIATAQQQSGQQHENIIATGVGFINTHADAIVLIWFLIICARCVRFAAGLQGVYYLKRTKVTAAGAYWEDKIAALADNMAIKRAVVILQSGIAKLPMVIGHFKPVILIPVGLLTALSTEEIESIILHELAHIKRKDYLVNLLQNLMEILFFFNPAILWVSALARTERENCCDDIVIAQTSSKVSYIQALVSCEEYRSATPDFAMGLGGKDGHFLQRVKRMLSNNNQSLNRIEKMVLTVCLVFAVLVTAAFSNAKNTNHTVQLKVKSSAPSVATAKINHSANSTVPKITIASVPVMAAHANADTTKKHTRSKDVSGEDVANELIAEHLIADKNDFKFKLNNRELVINGDKQPDDVFKNIIEKFVTPGDDSKFEINYTYHNNNQPAEYDNVTASGNSHSKGYTSSQSSSDNAGQQSSVSVSNGNNSISLSNGNASAQTSSSYGDDSRSYGRGYGRNGDDSEGAAINETLQRRNEAIGNELIKEGVIKNPDNYHFQLSNTDLTVDGIKQPDGLLQKILNKFIKPGETININFISVNNESASGTYVGTRRNYRYDRAQREAQEKARVDAVVADLVKDGIITTREHLTFELSNKQFVVNGQKQDDAVYQRYKQKFGSPDAKNTWVWSHSEDQ